MSLGGRGGKGRGWSGLGFVLSEDDRREDMMKNWEGIDKSSVYEGGEGQVVMYHATIDAIGVSRHSVELRRCDITDVGHSVSIRAYTLNECKHIVRTHVELIPDVGDSDISGAWKTRKLLLESMGVRRGEWRYIHESQVLT